jgi:hypothetical protein
MRILSRLSGCRAVPEFDVGLLTIRSGTRQVRVMADDSLTARNLIQAECDGGQCDCPPEACTDDVETTVLYVKQVALDEFTLIAGHASGTPDACDSVRSSRVPELSVTDRAQAADQTRAIQLGPPVDHARSDQA